MRKYVPAYEGNLRKHTLSVPRCISECSGIRVFGRRIKSLVFSTDVAIIKNINSDAIIAVYPFTPQPAITQAIIGVSDVPVFCGVGGGLTNGIRSASMAAYVEHQGAYGVVCNSKIGLETIHDIKDAVEIPVVYTVISEKTDIQPYLDAGDRGGAAGAVPGAGYHRHRRAYGGEYPVHHTGRGQRHYIHAAQQRVAVCQDHGGQPQRAGMRQRKKRGGLPQEVPPLFLRYRAR